MNWSRTLGCIFLVAGTSIGAGMLAIPLALSSLGFSASVLLLIGFWVLMAYTALLIVEVSLACGVHLNFHSLAQKTLGSAGVWVTNISLLFLFYALIASYTSGGASLLVSYFQIWQPNINTSVAALLFLGVFGGLITLGISKVDVVNRGLFLVKVMTLILILGLLLPMTDGQNLTALPLEKALIAASLPIIFASFGFHGSIPSIIQYIGGKPKTLRSIFLVGSAIPMLIYILWVLGIQGSLEQAKLMDITHQKDALPQLFKTLGQGQNHALLGTGLQIFANLALITSFLGVGIGLFDLLKDSCKQDDSVKGRLTTTALTFIPPLLLALFYPQGFISALGYAAIALAMLAVILPVLMVRQVRAQRQNTAYQVWGGTLGLWISATAGVLIIAVQLCVAFGFLPAL